MDYNSNRMRKSALSRFVVACITLFSMLSMQLAVASYICPMTGMGGNSTSAFAATDDVAQMSMAGCEGMDMQQPALCPHAFGDATKQSLDKSELPSVQPFMPAGMVLELPVLDAAFSQTAAPHATTLLTRATAPPIAIRHCCFRI